MSYFDFTPTALFKKTARDFDLFWDVPDAERLFNLLADLTHLAEWVYPEGKGREPKASLSKEIPEANLYCDLWGNQSYRIIRELCNRAKHRELTHAKHTENMKKIEGMRVGIARVGDRLGQNYFYVDGEDIRLHILNVYKIYTNYFEANTRQA